MEIRERKLKGVYEIILSPHADDRGFFMRCFDDKIFATAGIRTKWVQENHSRSVKKGIIRGLHFQFSPFAETKLVRCIRGAIRDVFVDLRCSSPTLGKWDAIELTEDNNTMVLIPPGFAHGFCTLTDICDVLYKVDNYYSPEHECGLLWNDKKLNIKWPVKNPTVSDKDKQNLSYEQFVQKYEGIKFE
jgi:dTDP-4-dehydrorhamnose 3,5-epimerase